jgi:hypothetical protein
MEALRFAICMIRSNVGLDVIVASHQLTPAAARSRGTSLAAPRVSHKLAVVLKDLESMGLSNVSAPLLKAFFGQLHYSTHEYR